MNIGVVGIGYVGLVVGSCLAETGHNVICIDNDEEKIKKLSDGHIPLYEPGLAEIVARNVSEDRLIFSTDLDDAIKKSFVIFVAVGTPQAGDEADLSAVYNVAESAGRSINRFKVIVVKSTVPVGTTERVRDIIRSQTDQPFDVIFNPEFLKEGGAVEDFMKPERIIIGAEDPRAAEIIREMYAPFIRTGNPVLVTDIRTAELTKYTANAFLATKISFMNEIANLCELVDADVEMIRRGIGYDSRIGPSFLFAGVGFGGSCFPKDIVALLHTARTQKCPLQIVEAAQRVNAAQRKRFLEKVLAHFGPSIGERRIAVWGLSFKPRTNDMRDAPAIEIINGLLENRAHVTAYDPEAIPEARKIFGSRVEFAETNYDCLEGADALLVLTEWPLFRHPDLERMLSMMRTPVIFDGRNTFEPSAIRSVGFTYYGIGRT